METQAIQPLRLNEWEKVQAYATDKFSEKIGGYPDRKEVKKTLPNPNKITWVIWVAVFVLFVLFVFTSIKVGAVAVPFSEKLLDTLTDHAYVIPEIQNLFKLSTILLFILLATPALIYFKLLGTDGEIEKLKEETAYIREKGFFRAWLNLKYITPRIPDMVVIISLAWLTIVSGYGVETDQQFWFIERWLPVLVELGLAYTVGQIAISQTQFNQLVDAEHKRLVDMYEARMNDRKVDKLYLNILSKYLFQQMFKLSRSGRKPNAWLETADSTFQQQAVLDEYLRLTSGDEFADKILKGGHTTKVQTIQEQAQPTIKREPPNGTNWTVEDMINDFRKRGLDPHMHYNQTNLDADYTGTGYRTAFRNGAKKHFLIHHN